ncbi:hypothetical protein APHAL10511_000087 [Amanita phalloides]|nr:hypothetical protein APHAL10511_000087 [Amanita phalloides]
MARRELWATGFDESVEVNQRALINKILARYSGEFTVFRELLQNSDDAESKTVEIHFDTEKIEDKSSNESDLPNLRTVNVHKWIFKNDGNIFQQQDWNRLKKIAEGNPDEDKIGAFGVGFYSVFSVTDTPFVTSGSHWMGFYWKDNKDQLFARRGDQPSESPSAWTSFELVLRDPAPMPSAFDLTRFISSSIVFMSRLSQVSIYFDNKCLAKLTKASGIPRELGIPNGLNHVSPQKTMRAKGLTIVPIQVKAEVLRWIYSTWTEKPRLVTEPTIHKMKSGGFFSSLISTFSGNSKRMVPEQPAQVKSDFKDPLSINTTSLSLSVFSANVEVQLEQKMVKALHRSTLKDPPTKLRYELIYTSKDEYDAAVKEDEQYDDRTMSVFHGLRADLEGSGLARIFIGHATAQTTGIGGHMAARFIPTVERESIDLMDPNVAVWNRELLFIGGLIARCAYEQEVSNISQIWGNLHEGQPNPTDHDAETWLLHRGLHALRFFTFYKSAPSEEVSAVFEDSFFSCAPKHFPIVSTRRVENAYAVRHPDPNLSAFMKCIPLVPQCLLEGSHRMVSVLRSRGMLKDISFQDVIGELRERPLDEQEMLACLQWWIQSFKSHPSIEAVVTNLHRDLIDAAVLAYGENKETLIQLSKIRTFINPAGPSQQIPLDGPLPEHLFPANLSKKLTTVDMSNCLRWTELTIIDWVKCICSPSVPSSKPLYNIDTSPAWAERVLTVLARVWPNLPATAKEEIRSLLADRTCIPTSQGMMVPTKAYFASADIFHDLPTVVFSSGAIKAPFERLLEALGVQKHVDLQIVFNRMVKTNEWTVADLIGYLISIRTTLTFEEVSRLKVTPAFSREGVDIRQKKEKPQRFQAKQLYEPNEALRQMGLPIIDWGTQKKWRSSSKEANFLFELGLRRHPPLSDLVTLCASNEVEIRQVSFKYLLDNIERVYSGFSVFEYEDVAFIPAIKDGKPCLGTANNVFVESEWASMGFLVLNAAYLQDAARLGILLRPRINQLVSLLEHNKPKNKAEARLWFELLAGRVNEITEVDRAELSCMPIVPHDVQANGSETQSYIPPIRCYFSDNNKTAYLSKLFVFVDFGVTANSFLAVCGAKRQPTVDEIAQILLEDPDRFYAMTGGHINFLAELRQIGINYHHLSSRTIDDMRRASCLLGAQRKARKKQQAGVDVDDTEDEDWEVIYHFRKPSEIVIADDTHSLRVFGNSLFIAPQEDILEDLYLKLGAHRLSLLVKEDYSNGAEVTASPLSTRIRTLVLERLPLFLHERNMSQLRFTFQWFNSEKNFVVQTFRGLNITKSFVLGNTRLAQRQDASAIVFRSLTGPVYLRLSNATELDMYEVAIALNRQLLEKPTANDALLLTTILSTDLGLLKKRGFNVERILKKHTTQHVTKVESSPKPATEEQMVINKAGNKNTPFTTLSRTLFGAKNTDKESSSGRVSPAIKSPEVTSSPPLSRANISRLSSTIEKAIRACHAESDSKIDVVQSVRENLQREYHDTCGAVNTLRFMGEDGQLKFYLAQEVPQPQLFTGTKRPVLKRFSNIIAELGSLFGLSLTSLHIFFDLSSQHIAFNRNGSLFFNLRFYEAWHDSDVIAGKMTDTYVFWYFTFAHEIAHNLVQDHNAEHEFYFSATSQKYIVNLFGLMKAS